MKYLQELGINLELGYWASLFCCSLLSLLDAFEKVTDCSRDDAQLVFWYAHVKASTHCVRLPRTSLEKQTSP